MKVNSAELKTHLGRYLRAVERDGTTFEVCLRDRTVAYLISATDTEPSVGKPKDALLRTLKTVGVRIDSTVPFRPTGALRAPVLAGDRKDCVVTVEQMRQDRDW